MKKIKKKKKWLSKVVAVMLSVAMVLSGMSLQDIWIYASDAKSIVNGVKYTYDSRSDTYSVSGFTDAIPCNVTLENDINGKAVTSIGWSAFYRCENLQNLVIPEGVTSIGWYAFEYCVNLTSISIPSSVTEIGNDLFGNCEKLVSIQVSEDNDKLCSDEDVLFSKDKQILYAYPKAKEGASYTMPSSVYEVKNRAFEHCNNLESITMQEGVMIIGERAFYSCYYLKDVAMPSSVKSIGSYAFAFCDRLVNTSLSENIMIIGDRAFCRTDLRNIYISKSVTSIGKCAFSYCSSLLSIDVSKNNVKYCSENGVLFSKDKQTLYTYPSAKAEKSYVIPYSVTSIKEAAFSCCKSLNSISIPEGIMEIEENTFTECKNLSRVTMPESLKSIGNWAFSDCISLSDITIPQNVINIGDYAFINCNLREITIPNRVTILGENIFMYCTRLSSITIPKSVTTIGKEAFYDCPIVVIKCQENSYTHQYALDNDIPFELITIELTDVLINGVEYSYDSESDAYTVVGYTDELPEHVMLECEINGKSVTKIGFGAFYNCKNLVDIEIPNSVTSIERSAFQFCVKLEGIVIPSSVTSIGSWAFSECGNNLKSVILSNGVMGIEEYAFYRCYGLTDIEIPSSLTSIGRGVFSDCRSLKCITVSEDNEFYSSEAGVLFNKNKTILFAYPKGKATTYTMPLCVESIGESAFDYCGGLVDVTIPESVKSIGEGAFYACSSLTIHCVENSYAHRYADNQGIPYELITVETATAPPTATPTGTPTTPPTASPTMPPTEEPEPTPEATANPVTTTTAEIRIHNNFWTTFLGIITFGIYYDDEQEVEILAESLVGIAKVECCITNRDVALDDVETLSYVMYDNNDRPVLRKGTSNIIYVKVTDNEGAIAYFRSDGVVINDEVIPTKTPITVPTVTPELTTNPIISPTISPATNKGVNQLKVSRFTVSSFDNKNVTLRWNKNPNASSYELYRSNTKNKGFRLIKKISKGQTEYIDKKIPPRKKYYYKIRAVAFSGNHLVTGSYTVTRSIKVSGLTTPVISVKNGSTGSGVKYLTVQLNKYSGNYVEIYFQTDRRKYEKIKLVANHINKNKEQFKIRYLTDYKNMHIKVRTYKMSNHKKVYSRFSNPARLKLGNISKIPDK